MWCYVRLPEALLNNRVKKKHDVLVEKHLLYIELIVFCGTNYKLPGERGWFIPTTFGVWNGLCNWWNTTVDCNLCNLLAPAILIASSRKFLPLTAMTSSFLSLAMMLSSQFVRFGLARSSCTEVRTNRFPKKNMWVNSFQNRKIGKITQTKSSTWQ